VHPARLAGFRGTRYDSPPIIYAGFRRVASPTLIPQLVTMRPIHALCVTAMVCLSLPACSSAVRKPQLEHPGRVELQRANAEVFDPYPENDLAPAIDGGRPREVGPPRNQVERSQQFLRSHGLRPRQEVPFAAPLPATTAPVTVGPPVPVGPPVIATPRY
jgi:hypothetical protein